MVSSLQMPSWLPPRRPGQPAFSHVVSVVGLKWLGGFVCPLACCAWAFIPSSIFPGEGTWLARWLVCRAVLVLGILHPDGDQI